MICPGSHSQEVSEQESELWPSEYQIQGLAQSGLSKCLFFPLHLPQAKQKSFLLSCWAISPGEDNHHPRTLGKEKLKTGPCCVVINNYSDFRALSVSLESPCQLSDETAVICTTCMKKKGIPPFLTENNSQESLSQTIEMLATRFV